MKALVCSAPGVTVAAALSVLSGCATTSIHSGRPPGEVAPGYDQRWHAAFVFGALPARDYDVSRICPGGWAEIRLEPDAFTALAGLVTLFLYSPSRVTVVCARPAGAADGPPPLKAYPVPGR